MKCILWSSWADINAAHTDPFSNNGQVHGHLWRIRIGIEQPLNARMDARQLISAVKGFAELYDHTYIGEISTEDIAVNALAYIKIADRVEVEESGICTVQLYREV